MNFFIQLSMLIHNLFDRLFLGCLYLKTKWKCNEKYFVTVFNSDLFVHF
jgi:hypothetical protein